MKTNKLPKVFKKKWIAALRGGKYKQGGGSLFEDGCHCCIGVAGSICGISNRAMLNKGLFQINEFTEKTLKKYNKLMPDNFISFKGFFYSDATIIKLSRMNDIGDSFEKIANWIEKNM